RFWESDIDIITHINYRYPKKKKMDAFGKSDKFITFKAGDEEQEISTAKNTYSSCERISNAVQEICPQWRYQHLGQKWG
ncbi:MAG: hypothetical protein EZS28_049806, partial [Streblomastix strix]